MTTVINTPRPAPVVEYDKLHIDQLRLKHRRDQDSPIEIRIIGTLFGYDANGTKHFSPESFQTVMPNAMVMILQGCCAMEGKTLPQIAADYANAKDNLMAKFASGQVTDLDLMAAFELTIARMLEIDGKFQIKDMD